MQWDPRFWDLEGRAVDNMHSSVSLMNFAMSVLVNGQLKSPTTNTSSPCLFIEFTNSVRSIKVCFLGSVNIFCIASTSRFW